MDQSALGGQEQVGPVVVTTWAVTSEESVRQVVRAIQRTHWRRFPHWWRAWAAQWAIVVVAMAMLTWLFPARDSVPVPLTMASSAFALVVLFGLDIATMPWRVGRTVRKSLLLQAPPGTVVKGTFEENRVGFATPDATHAVSTGAVTRATWVEGCLVLDTKADKFYTLHGSLVSDEAWRVVTRALGARLHRV